MKFLKVSNIIIICIILLSMLFKVIIEYNKESEIFNYYNSIGMLKQDMAFSIDDDFNDAVGNAISVEYINELNMLERDFNSSKIKDDKSIINEFNKLHFIIEYINSDNDKDSLQYSLIKTELNMYKTDKFFSQLNWYDFFLKEFKIQKLLGFIILIFWIKYVLGIFKEHKYLYRIYNIKFVGKLYKYVSDCEVITFNIIILYFISIIISGIYLFTYGYSLVPYDFIEPSLYTLIFLVSIISLILYFKKSSILSIMKLVFISGFFTYYSALSINNMMHYDFLSFYVLISLLLVPIEIEFIKELKIKVNIKI